MRKCWCNKHQNKASIQKRICFQHHFVSNHARSPVPTVQNWHTCENSQLTAIRSMVNGAQAHQAKQASEQTRSRKYKNSCELHMYIVHIIIKYTHISLSLSLSLVSFYMYMNYEYNNINVIHFAVALHPVLLPSLIWETCTAHIRYGPNTTLTF